MQDYNLDGGCRTRSRLHIAWKPDPDRTANHAGRPI